MIQTNLALANTICKHMIKRDLDYPFQYVFTGVKHNKNTPQIFQTILIKFL